MISLRLVVAAVALCLHGQAADSLPASRAKPHYRVITIPEAPFVQIYKNGTFGGPYVEQLQQIANQSGFTIEIASQPDGKYGSKVNGKWNGMIGTLLSGKADIVLGNMVLTDERAAVLDSGSVLSNLPLWLLVDPKKPKDKAQYMVMKDIVMETLKASKDKTSQLIWKNIEDHRPVSIVKDINQAVSKALLGNFIYVDTEDNIRLMESFGKPTLVKDSVPLNPNVPIAYLTTIKGSPLATILQLHDGGIDAHLVTYGTSAELAFWN